MKVFLGIFAVFLAAMCSAFDEDPCLSKFGGNCVSSCGKADNFLSGKCPTQAANIKCCTPWNEEPCISLGGQCQRNDKACSGSFQSGKCPTQASNIKCCVGQATTTTPKTCPLVKYANSRFTGGQITAEREFIPLLDKINNYALQADVKIYITSSFRTSTDVDGAIVTPATYSNHLVGHAIDMNVLYGPNYASWCNSSCLKGSLPSGVKAFIKSIQDDTDLRWGGDFNTPDVVHIDDGLNVNNMDKWNETYQLTQEAYKNGCVD